MTRNHIHFIGIAGKTMAPLAKMFMDMGWQVTGSDQKAVYPPITTYLEENNIDFARGYSEKNLSEKPDLVVVGRSALLINQENPEVVKAKKFGCPILSYPEVLRNFLVKENSIVTAGTYGKTTLASLLAWILEKAGFNPSFMIGGVSLNFSDGVRNTPSSYSVIEGDETPAMLETDLPKFMFYKPKFVLLTAAKWDHPEIFKNENDYILAFKKFVKLIPQDGLLVACGDGENIKEVARVAKCQVVWYSSETKNANFWLEKISFATKLVSFEVVTLKERILLETSLLGRHNLQNICGAVALCRSLGIETEIIKNAIRTFKGIKTRLENLGTFGGITVFFDFAQHPAKVKESLTALRVRFPKSRIFCVFDPHASLLKQRESLTWYPGKFDKANQVIVTKMAFLKTSKKENRVKGPEIVRAIAKTQPNVFYEPIDEKVIDFLINEPKRKDIIIFMSSGGLKITTMIEKTIAKLKKDS
ncbi:MAG: UDP-N-acetylmuramate--L-alanine ligase [Patescibacteria group bacterium]